MSPKRKTLPLLPYANGRRVPLFNRKATYTIGHVFKLMAHHQLYEALLKTESAKSTRRKRALFAIKMWEENGYQNGLDPHDLAAALGCTYRAARNAMNQAGDMMWTEFGLIVSFLGERDPWRLLNHMEAALRYRKITKGNHTRQQRAEQCRGAAEYHGTEKGELKAPLYDFDFKDAQPSAGLN